MTYEFNIPLFFRTHDMPNNGGFPDLYPFKLKLADSYGIPTQESNEELKQTLQRIYSEGVMMIGSMDEGDLAGNIHATDAITFTCDSLSDMRGKRILEIGCGRGVILNQLASRGANCVGLEPGQQIRHAKGDGIRLINDFFPSPNLAREKFDAITSYNVIEHIEHLESFLESVNESLVEDGDFIFCVPNCGPYLASGDVSILLHEHFNYFSKTNIIRVLQVSGFSLERVDVSRNTALLLVHAKKSGSSGNAQSRIGQSNELDSFINAMQGVKSRLESSMSKFSDDEIAVYCPNRALNVMCQIGRQMVRIVEDTPAAKGRYYPYFRLPVENFSGLSECPPKAVYVFSYTHGDLLRARCQREPRLDATEIHVVSDFY